MVGATARPLRGQRGAAAVEAAILVSVVLVPLLSGILYWGNYFWQAQQVSTLSVTGIPPESVSGTYSCSQLVSKVKGLLATNVAAIAGQLRVPSSTITTTVRVIRVIPDIGADIEVSIRVPVVSELTSLLPLPNNGAIIQEATQRLDHVKVSTASC